jgi:hypothetical protein
MEQNNQPEKQQTEYRKSSFLSYWTDVFRPGAKKSKNFNLRAMHAINKISIVMFLICLVILVVKCVR